MMMMVIIIIIIIIITSCAGERHNIPPPLQVDLWPCDLESGVRVMCLPILVFLGFSLLDLGPMYAATDRRQTASSLNAPPRGRGHNNLNKNLCSRDGRTICGPQCMPKSNECHCNSLGGATWRSVTITGRTDRRTDRQTDRQTDRRTDRQSATHNAAPSYGGGPHKNTTLRKLNFVRCVVFLDVAFYSSLFKHYSEAL